MDPSFLSEFNFTFGDPRPVLQTFLLQNYKSIVSPSFVFNYKCVNDPDTGKLTKVFTPPKKTELEEYQDTLKSESPLLLIPVLITNKLTCTRNKRNYAKHIVYLLYNKLTKECERLDIKKYHITNFFIKSSANKLKNIFVPQYIGDNVKSFNEVDIPTKFI